MKRSHALSAFERPMLAVLSVGFLSLSAPATWVHAEDLGVVSDSSSEALTATGNTTGRTTSGAGSGSHSGSGSGHTTSGGGSGHTTGSTTGRASGGGSSGRTSTGSTTGHTTGSTTGHGTGGTTGHTSGSTTGSTTGHGSGGTGHTTGSTTGHTSGSGSGNVNIGHHHHPHGGGGGGVIIIIHRDPDPCCHHRCDPCWPHMWCGPSREPRQVDPFDDVDDYIEDMYRFAANGDQAKYNASFGGQAAAAWANEGGLRRIADEVTLYSRGIEPKDERLIEKTRTSIGNGQDLIAAAFSFQVYGEDEHKHKARLHEMVLSCTAVVDIYDTEIFSSKCLVSDVR